MGFCFGSEAPCTPPHSASYEDEVVEQSRSQRDDHLRLRRKQNPAYTEQVKMRKPEDYFFGVFRYFLGRVITNVVPFFSELENFISPPKLSITIREI